MRNAFAYNLLYKKLLLSRPTARKLVGNFGENCVDSHVPFLFFFLQENCTEVIFNTAPPFKRLDHYKLHEYTRKWNFSSANKEPVTMTLTTSIDAMFKRKRGRPPKNRVIEVSQRLDFTLWAIHFIFISSMYVLTQFRLR